MRLCGPNCLGVINAFDRVIATFGQFVAEPALLRESVRLVLADPQVDIGIVWLQLMDAHVDTLIAIFEEIKAAVAKPFVVCWVAAPERALAALRSRGIAVLRGADPAVDACAALAYYGAARRAWAADAPFRRMQAPAAPVLPSTAGVMDTILARELLEAAGVIVQRMIAGGVEMVVGLHNDTVFGTVIMTGLGGVHVKVLNDVVFRKAPVDWLVVLN